MNGLWYAVMRDLTDTDWGYGSYDPEEADNMVHQLQVDGNPYAYIAVIAEGENPVCIAEIY